MGLFDSFFGGGDDVELPPAPDPQKILREQAQANRVDQFTPFGSLTFGGGPYRNQATLALNPRLQALLDAQTGAATGAVGRADAFTGAASPVSVMPADQVAGQVFDLGATQLRPEFDQRRTRLQERLTQSGNPGVGNDLAPGAVSELDLLGRQENAAFRELALASALAVPEYQGRMVSNAATAATTNANIGLGFGAAGGSLIPGLDDFYGPQGLDVTGAYGTANDYALRASQLQQERDSSMLGGLFDLGTFAADFFYPGSGTALRGIKGMSSGGGGGFTNPAGLGLSGFSF